ncbi:2-hydroxychromene-2-carboxylate isomerase [Marinibaculum pumilum]|uniref:2-hydroxychromene-2-carboxylate isomerase n=1 Tax=Marinibaculum pumilum TaxID=1766165 RepID=A0ABV7L297_9PROT
MQIDYFFTCASPWSFLGLAPLRETARRHGAAIVCHPVSYGTIFPATGGLPLPKRAPERQAYRLVELRRWRAFREVDLVLEPKHFPVDDSLANRTVLAAREGGADAEKVLDLAHSFQALLWLEDGDLSALSTLAGRANELGLDGAHLVEQAATPEIQSLYEKETQAAIAAGVFGAPTYMLGGELFWGQDRVDFLDRALEQRGAA